MPGLYTEPASRAAPTNDSACDQYEIINDRGQPTALSYKYQCHCPNDQNLIAVLGREPGATDPPTEPLLDRHGIPDLGSCIRCNLQIEGSGVGPDDVTIDAGRVKSGDGGPHGSAKDVGIRVDRADGTVIRNVKVRHAREHTIYVLEADGYVLDRFKVFYPGEYGVLTFVEDHGLMQNCEAVGADDAGLYPGSGADTGVGRDSAPQSWKDYPLGSGYSYGEFRYSQEIRNCDSHHNAAGYSGTDGNATHLHHNNIYDNVLGFTTDVFTAAGHPGFPQDSDLVEFNNFYSNNFDAYHAQPAETELHPGPPFPIGVGLWIAGGNDNVVRYNHFWDNWRRATMTFAVPDQLVCGPGVGIDPAYLAGCNPSCSAAVHLVQGRVLRQRDGPGALRQSSAALPRPAASGPMRWMDTRRAGAQRRRKPFGGPGRLLVGRVLGQHGELLARQRRPGRHGGKPHQPAAFAASGKPRKRAPRPAAHLRRHERGRRLRIGAGSGAPQLPRRFLDRGADRNVYVVHASRPTRPPRPTAPKQGTNRPGAVVLRRAARRAAAVAGDSEQRADGPPQPTLPVALRHAECSDWRKGTVDAAARHRRPDPRVRGRPGRIVAGNPERTHAR